MAGFYYAPKDFMAPGARRVLVQSSGCLAGLGVYVLDPKHRNAAPENNHAGSDSNNAQESRDEAASQTSEQRVRMAQLGSAESSENHPAKNWLIGTGVFVGVASLLGASMWATLKLDRWAVGKLQKRGVKYPNSVWGAVNFVAAVAALAFDD